MYTDDELTKLAKLAQLGDWAAIHLLVVANVLPESMLPPMPPMPSMPPNAAMGIYAWRRGYHDLARRIWADCSDNDAAVLIAQCDPDDRLELIRALPDCHNKRVQLAIAYKDGAELEALRENREAGLAYMRANQLSDAQRLLCAAAVNDRDETACRLVLPLVQDDLNVLQTLAQHCAHGKVGLGDYLLRADLRDDAIAQYRAAGIFVGGPRLVAMNVMDATELKALETAFINSLNYTCNEFVH